MYRHIRRPVTNPGHTDGSWRGYNRELSPLYSSKAAAVIEREKIVGKNPYQECRVEYLPLIRKWVVVC